MRMGPLSILLFCGLLSAAMPLARAQVSAAPAKAAEPQLPVSGTPTPAIGGSADNDRNKNPSPACSRADWLANKCSAYPGANAPPRYRRPIVIVPQATTPPLDDTPLASDWEGCRKTKLNQLNLTENGNLERAKQLDEWLWKNCRSYSEELRQLEQDRM